MTLNQLLKPFRKYWKSLFHTRSIIIISKHKTSHMSLSGGLQLLTITVVLTVVGIGSFSTGKYMAVKSVVKQQDATLRSVAQARIESNFNYYGPNSKTDVIGPVSSAYDNKLMTDPSYALPGAQDKLYARLAFLESRVNELKNTNEEIVQTVRTKASSKIAGLEDVINKTGVDINAVKDQMIRQRKEEGRPVDESALKNQGGPFISPGDVDENSAEALDKELNVRLEQISLLNDIVSVMPLGVPIANGEPQSPFGRRVDPFTGRMAFHAGLDLSSVADSPIMATNAGVVTDAGWDGAYGNKVDIGHGGGFSTRYGHMKEIHVNVGDVVRKGQVIGIQGSTGRSTGPHVHYEVRFNGELLNPQNFLKVGQDVSQN